MFFVYIFKILLTVALAAVSANAEVNITTMTKAAEAERADIPLLRTAAPITAISRTATDYSKETWNSIGQGKYIASEIAGCYGVSIEPVDVQVFESQGTKGLYKVVGVWPEIFSNGNGTIYIDASDPEFVQVKKQSVGIKDDVDGMTYISSMSAIALDEYNYTKETFLAGFSDQNAYVKDGNIVFPEGSLSLQWPEAPENGKYGTDPTEWYSYAENTGRLVLPGAEYVDPWGDAVDGTIVETSISPLFSKTNTNPYQVKVYRNSESGLYRIKETWKQLYTALGIQSTSPDLDIDASDPDNMIIELQPIGINGGETDGKYYVMSLSYYNSLGDEPTETADEFKITLKNNGDGTSTITMPYRSTRLYAATSNQIYYANNIQTPTTITFKTFTSAIGNIGTDAADYNAEAVYYNLQGVKVDKPAAGQLVIKRQGSKVTKEIIR